MSFLSHVRRRSVVGAEGISAASPHAQVREKNDKFQQRKLDSMFAGLPLPSAGDGDGGSAELMDMEDAVLGGDRQGATAGLLLTRLLAIDFQVISSRDQLGALSMNCNAV
jgi:hypothetical protein